MDLYNKNNCETKVLYRTKQLTHHFSLNHTVSALFSFIQFTVFIFDSIYKQRDHACFSKVNQGLIRKNHLVTSRYKPAQRFLNSFTSLVLGSFSEPQVHADIFRWYVRFYHPETLPLPAMSTGKTM